MHFWPIVPVAAAVAFAIAFDIARFQRRKERASRVRLLSTDAHDAARTGAAGMLDGLPSHGQGRLAWRRSQAGRASPTTWR